MNVTISLRNLQENFQSYLLEEDKTGLAYISTDRADAIERIDIYRIGYSLRLLDVLEKDFPNFKKYMGDEQFEKLGREYIQHYPSNHYSICIFSRFFSQYLAESGYDASWSEFIAFEWAVACVLDAADADHLKMTDMSAVTGEQWAEIQFILHPSVVEHSYIYNTPKIVHALMWDQVPPALEHYTDPTHYLIWRYQLTSHFDELTPQQLCIFHSIQNGRNFAEICEDLCSLLPEDQVPSFVGGTLGSWIEKGIFTAFRLEDS